MKLISAYSVAKFIVSVKSSKRRKRSGKGKDKNEKKKDTESHNQAKEHKEQLQRLAEKVRPFYCQYVSIIL